VVTLGGCEVPVDRWAVDVATAGTQKCLSCPSGLAPVTFNARAERVIRARRTRIRSNYRDLGQLADYWRPGRFHHHSAPTSIVSLQGKIWRIGTMGYSAQRQNILLCLGALEHVLRHEGFRTAAGAGVDAALAHYTAAGATGVLDIDDNLGATGIGRV